jgi:hypothetical protein
MNDYGQFSIIPVTGADVFNDDERAAMFRFSFPSSENPFIVTDAFDRGSFVKIIPEKNKP